MTGTAVTRSRRKRKDKKHKKKSKKHDKDEARAAPFSSERAPTDPTHVNLGAIPPAFAAPQTPSKGKPAASPKASTTATPTMKRGKPAMATTAAAAAAAAAASKKRPAAAKK
eukprot:2416170-Pyramimonas_sp.AAC.1